MLKMTGIELELISEIVMYLFVEKGMKGGIPCIAKRHRTANNKYMKSYDDKKPGRYIMYLDANNFHGWAVSQYLLYSRFKWLNQKEINKFCLNPTEFDSVKENSSDGYILQVGLEYPKEA